jgi:hypothetical protein
MLAEEKQHQFIATHSTVFAAPSADMRVFHVYKIGGASELHDVRDLPSLREIKQMLGFQNTDLYSYNAVVQERRSGVFSSSGSLVPTRVALPG